MCSPLSYLWCPAAPRRLLAGALHTALVSSLACSETFPPSLCPHRVEGSWERRPSLQTTRVHILPLLS